MRNRSMAIVMRNGTILMEEVYFEGRHFYTLPGGGMEEGESPEETVLRELKEECGLDGNVIRLLNVIHRADGSEEYTYQVEVSEDQVATTGYDPEFPLYEQVIEQVRWMKLNELSEKDRAFLWSYGLMEVEGFLQEVISWGDEISWPK